LTAATAAGKFAAERPRGRRYQSIAVAGAQQQRRLLCPQYDAAARRSAANAGSGSLRADVGG